MQVACYFTPALKWDDALPEVLQRQVDRGIAGLKNVSGIYIPRHYSPRADSIIRRELHSFCDGSARAYGANVYLRQVDTLGRVYCSLVIAKNRVAPARKTLTIPRTELCSAVIAADLVTIVQREIPEKIDEVVLWSDSTTTLKFIANTHRRYQIFVGNRTQHILGLTRVEQWRFVEGVQNPADDLTRGVVLTADASFDRSRRWFCGPEWLYLEPENWPQRAPTSTLQEDDPELAKEKAVCFTAVAPESLMDSASSVRRMRMRIHGGVS